MDGFRNIPVDELRERINETNAKKSGLEVDTVILSPMSHAGYYPCLLYTSDAADD